MIMLPTEKDFDPFEGNLDAQWAWKHFGGLSLDEAFNKFQENPLCYEEDFLFMGHKAFVFYFPVLDRYLREMCELPPALRNYLRVRSIPQCIQFQFDDPVDAHLLSIKEAVIELCELVLTNLKDFLDEWVDEKDIEKQWQQLKQRVSQYS